MNIHVIETGKVAIKMRQRESRGTGSARFINTLIEFLIIAFVVFMLVRSVNNMMARMEKATKIFPLFN